MRLSQKVRWVFFFGGTPGRKERVSKSVFKARALESFREIESTGESLVLTDHGRPVLEVRPYKEDEIDPLDTLRRSVVRYERPTDPVADDEWESGR